MQPYSVDLGEHPLWGQVGVVRHTDVSGAAFSALRRLPGHLSLAP